MRQLTHRQKKLLDQVLENTHTPIYTVDDLPIEIWEELEAINDTEILWQECNRYISDTAIRPKTTIFARF